MMKATIGKPLAQERDRLKPGPLPNTIRHLLLSLTIPSLLAGCAQESRIDPLFSHTASTAQARRVFLAGPSRYGPQRADTYAASLPELSSAFSTSAIIQNILARKRLIAKSRPLAPTPAQAAKGQRALAAGSVRVIGRTNYHFKRGRKAREHWDSLRGNLLLAGVQHEAVVAQLDELRRHPAAVDFLMKRAEPYLQYLLEEIDRHGLPPDLILVPMVESAFEANALSPKQAAGIWQFIPSTGAQYGLSLTDGYDGRYDLHASTQAAMKYLKHLNALFGGDWLLTLAAYNAGEGAVGRAVEASKKTGQGGSFWELDLPAETEAYVVKILALAHAVGNPEANGFKGRKAGFNTAALTRVEVRPEARVADVAAAAGMAPEEFYRLNPAFKPDLPPPSGTYQVMMPSDKAEALAGNLAGAKVFAMRKVIVKKGETLSILAKRHGVPALKLAEWNGLNPKAPLKPGQELVVYPA
jgi:membrane-bound lytic murein transglycosylase D